MRAGERSAGSLPVPRAVPCLVRERNALLRPRQLSRRRAAGPTGRAYAALAFATRLRAPAAHVGQNRHRRTHSATLRRDARSGYLKCLDTGCCMGGWLTALDVESRQVWQVDERGQERAEDG